MRMVFSILGLLITLAIVGWVVKQQAQAVRPQAAQHGSVASGEGGASAAAPQNAVQQVRQDLGKALAQDLARAASGVEP